MTNIFATVFVAILIIVFGYVLWRVFWKGAARSWFEEKLRIEKGEKDGKKQGRNEEEFKEENGGEPFQKGG